VTPIYQSATFEFPDTRSLILFQQGRRKGFLYTRYGNPTIEAVEKKLAGLDGAESSLLFSSGMAAISSACLTLLSPGDEILSSSPIYGGTRKLFDDILRRLGIKTRYFPAGDIRLLERAVTERTGLVYLESPTNPNLHIIDLALAGKIARKKGLFSIIDSTFATPYNQRPLKFGINAVIHSATKYLGGHSDIMGGVLSGGAEFIGRVSETRNPNQAFLLDRGLKTLEIRVARHNQNALAVARFLQTLKGIKAVYYPGLESHPGHKLASSQMAGYGGVVSFDLGSGKKAARFADSLKVIKNAASLGGTESLI